MPQRNPFNEVISDSAAGSKGKIYITESLWIPGQARNDRLVGPIGFAVDEVLVGDLVGGIDYHVF